VVGNGFMGRGEKYSDIILPRCTYTEPEVASVGKTKQTLEEMKIEYDVYKSDLIDNDRAICEEKTRGFIKFYTEKNGETILGCTIVGGPAGEMITHVTSAMFNKIGLSKIGGGVTPYPVYAEGIKACTGQIMGKMLR
jgi:pyruvate/2-oxoglutarate dehydrogenase complex dihydrolipoamide dehydrogenase (E3) component